MAGPRPPDVELSAEERSELERLVRAHATGQTLALRARIVLAAAEGLNNAQIERAVGCDVETASIWRRRWLEKSGVPIEECSVAARLADAPRPGATARIVPEQVCQIVALACEQPDAASGRPISHWSHRELADEIMRRGIVDRISPRHAGRLLKSPGPQAASDPLLADSRRR